MAVMGDAAPEVWAAEFRRTGRVEFPQRRVRLAFRLGMVLVPGLSNTPQVVRALFGDGIETGQEIFGVVIVLLMLTVIAIIGRQWITGRPLLVVDTTGVRTGRRAKHALAWSEIAAVGYVGGFKGLWTVPVISRNAGANPLNVSQDNVKDVPAFARWLQEVRQQRQTEVPG